MIESTRLEAVILDLDGVVTNTAGLHARAWKEIFDQLLRNRAVQNGAPYEPFDADSDYRRYVDGKPRYDGVRDFLASRDISLPEGDSDDPPDAETICGVGNRKNHRFHELLQDEGPGVYDDAVTQINRWHESGIKSAIVSSSRNCKAVLHAGGLESLFSVRVDGSTAVADGLQGKPAPDYFLDAARRLGVQPKDAAVVEDAISGVQAGRAGRFGLVVGVDRANVAEALHDNGADVVVRELTELDEMIEPASAGQGFPRAIEPSDLLEALRDTLEKQAPAVFLDYDGTLTPIVSRPDLAIMSDAMRDVIGELAQHCTVAIISGRDRANVEQLVDLEKVIYAGSHGFDIAGPDGLRLEHEGGRQCLPALDDAEQVLKKSVGGIDGILVERKRYAIAIHYRNVDPQRVNEIERAVNDVAESHESLRQSTGKKIFELHPNIDWNKGRAVLWLLDTLDLDRPDVLPFYIGDDLTDEDAFRAFEERGIGMAIGVGELPEQTAARYRLRNVDDVRAFLNELLNVLRQANSCSSGH
mgnify:CR=1 FL=1